MKEDFSKNGIISVLRLCCGYEGREILHNISLELYEGQLVCLLGRNGTGKSTLLKCLLGFIEDFSGEVLIEGKSVRRLNARQLSAKVSYIPQNYYRAFSYSVMDMVLMGTAAELSDFQAPKKKQQERAYAALTKLGIEELSERSFVKISGGEQKLVLMARSIVQNARIWILDEPLSDLDYGNRIRVMEKLKDLAREGYCILMSIHDPDIAYEYSDRIIGLKEGCIIADGRAEAVLNENLIKQLYGEDISWKRKSLM